MKDFILLLPVALEKKKKEKSTKGVKKCSNWHISFQLLYNKENVYEI